MTTHPVPLLASEAPPRPSHGAERVTVVLRWVLDPTQGASPKTPLDRPIGYRSWLHGAAALVVLGLGSTAAAQGRFVGAGTLELPRTAHTATRLPDGRVLVAGGRSLDGTRALASTELFDPRTRTWRRGPPLATARSHHTATLLSDGRVLVTGGSASTGEGAEVRFTALASAELYEPWRDRWVRVAGMGEARSAHAAVLLQDGGVLVVGGAREGPVLLASAERFDPRWLVFTSVAPLGVARAGHEVVRVHDGTVLVLGGRGPAGALDAVERFDPRSGTWTPAPPLSEPRQRLGVSMLGRGVLVVGGQTGTSVTNLGETWRPGDDAWRSLEASLPRSLAGHTASTLADGDVLVVGGEPVDEVDSPRAVRWVGRARRWCQAGALAAGRAGHTATVLRDGRVLVVGGTSSAVPEARVELWEARAGRCVTPADR